MCSKLRLSLPEKPRSRLPTEKLEEILSIFYGFWPNVQFSRLLVEIGETKTPFPVFFKMSLLLKSLAIECMEILVDGFNVVVGI